MVGGESLSGRMCLPRGLGSISLLCHHEMNVETSMRRLWDLRLVVVSYACVGEHRY